ncbi:MAG: prepilin-type N-terminal cleavage/methylation domain-containing protein [Methylobacter sp.]|nr:prepilin-type N-terminal cleavage/methylation domain-containing protein [Methylobacter sp.]
MKKQSGLTLIEIMIALLIGLIIIAATITIYITTIKGSSDTLKSARLNHDLESAMALMVNDIRRAGYWGGAIAGADSTKNPFTIGTADIQIPTASCILYTYDADPDGPANITGINTPTDLTDDVDANEYYGFKLDGTTIRMRLTGTTTADCTDGSWGTGEMIEGNKISITALTFTSAYKCLNVTTALSYNTTCQVVTAANLVTGQKAVESRQINITLNGSLVSDPTVTKTLTSTVKVRNDRIFTQP